MSMSTLVRKGTPRDADAVAALSYALWPGVPLEEHLSQTRETLAERASSTMPLVIFVAEVDGAVIAFIEVGLRSHADGCDPRQPVGFVEGWFVAAPHRRSGVGAALLRAAEAWARERGCREMASDTWIDADVSQAAHEALGFEMVDRCVNYRKSLV